jgi:cysteamine dioxygenase
MDDYSRRDFIRTSLPGFLGLTMALPSITALATRANACNGRFPENGAINWDGFLEAIGREAGRQHLDDWSEPDYVEKAAAIVSRLDLDSPELAKAFEQAKAGIGNRRVDFDKLEMRRDFQISFVQFEKGEEIHHHDHPGMTGVLLCATGTIDVWNYDELDQQPGNDTLLLKQSALAELTKANVSTLTSRDRNIHRLKARSLTQLVDIFAPPYNKDRVERSRWFDVDPEPYQGRKDIFEASIR